VKWIKKKPSKRPRYDWQVLLKRVFGSQLKLCLHCDHDKLKIIAGITQSEVIDPILDYLGLYSQAPPRGEACSKAFEQESSQDDFIFIPS